jgi:broad specificity phosphatase PhoE
MTRTDIDPLDVLSWLERERASTGRLFLFLRHSRREEIPAGQLGFQARLTNTGTKLARRFGERIRQPIANIISSPVGRCIETSRAIQAGYGAPVATTTANLLAEPGAFVVSCELAGDLMYEHRGLEMVNLLLARQQVSGLRTLKDGCHLLVQLLRETPARPGDLSLLISHDTVLAPFVYGLLARTSIETDDWPEYLEGCGLSLGPHSLQLHWRDRTTAVPLGLEWL